MEIKKINKKDTSPEILSVSRKAIYSAMELGSLYSHVLLNHASVKFDEKKTMNEIKKFFDGKVRKIREFQKNKYGASQSNKHEHITSDQTDFMLEGIELLNLAFDSAAVRRNILKRLEKVILEANKKYANGTLKDSDN